jgi:hypothetical protein
MPFQPDSAPLFSGTISTVVFSPGPNPTTIVTVNTPWNIRVDWSVTGFTVSGLGGEWQVRGFLESMGPGFEGQVPPAPAPAVQVTSVPLIGGITRNYTQVLAVPANPAILAGPYKLVVTITHTNAGIPTTYAAYIEGPILQFIP